MSDDLPEVQTLGAQQIKSLRESKTRINVFEEWESEEALAAHFQHIAYTGMRDHIGQFGITAAVSKKYRVDAEGPVYNAEGVATEAFD